MAAEKSHGNFFSRVNGENVRAPFFGGITETKRKIKKSVVQLQNMYIFWINWNALAIFARTSLARHVLVTYSSDYQKTNKNPWKGASQKFVLQLLLVQRQAHSTQSSSARVSISATEQVRNWVHSITCKLVCAYFTCRKKVFQDDKTPSRKSRTFSEQESLIAMISF